MLLLLCAAGANAQQMYKWVDSKGVTHYSDTPAPDGKKAEVKALTPGAELVPLPYALVSASRAAPVTLYTAVDCKGCDDGRKMLQTRGIPYAEKTVSTYEDQVKLKEAGSEGRLPMLVVGRTKLVGFEPSAWNGALDAAAYPAKNILPARYRNAAPVAAAPMAPAAAPAPNAAEREARDLVRVAEADAAAARWKAERDKKKNDTPPGFQF
ncbi:glutaredoxin family protein [Massilia cavernae]|uniref:Glutaredoxin family protein n=2 Tax=Massilia cavernae TaxID=2320864 RepID=A0A418Y787_9BURK|nr:glutaredoxin family protein [Massilia cavernae]